MNGIALHENNLFNGLPVAQSLTGFLRGFFMDEIWMPVIGYEGLYEVSNIGRVKSLERKVETKGGALRSNKERIMKQTLNRYGYMRLSLMNKANKKIHYVHVIVFESFVSKRNGKQVNHMDSNKLNNNLENLELVTSRENTNHYYLSKSNKPIGVHEKRGRYYSLIEISGKLKNLGTFDTIEEASKAYRDALPEKTKY